MRMFTVLLMLLLSSSYVVAQDVFRDNTQQVIISHEGKDREMLVFFPPSAMRKARNNRKGVPVVFMFHGTGGDGLKFWKISQWKEKALDKGFIAVFPSALKYHLCEEDRAPRVTSKWVTQKIPEILCNPDAYLADDQVLFRKMVRYLENHYPVNSDRIYASGFSNGNAFVQELVSHNSHLLAAAAGNGTIGIYERPEFPIPFYSTVGDEDPKVLEKIGLDKLPLDSSILSIDPINERLAITLENLGLEYAYRSITTPDRFKAVFKRKIDNPRRNTELHYHVMGGLLHQYPNGTNYPIKMADILWKFFSRFSR